MFSISAFVSVIMRNLKLSGDLLAESDEDQKRSSSVEQQNINNTQAAADKVKPKKDKEAGLLTTYLDILRNPKFDKVVKH